MTSVGREEIGESVLRCCLNARKDSSSDSDLISASIACCWYFQEFALIIESIVKIENCLLSSVYSSLRIAMSTSHASPLLLYCTAVITAILDYIFTILHVLPAAMPQHCILCIDYCRLKGDVKTQEFYRSNSEAYSHRGSTQ